MTLQINSTGARQQMIQVAKYESPLDRGYVQNLPTILEELNLPNTRLPNPFGSRNYCFNSGGKGTRGIYIVNYVWQGGVRGFVVACP